MCTSVSFYERLGREIIERKIRRGFSFADWCRKNGASPDSVNDVIQEELGTSGEEIFRLL